MSTSIMFFSFSTVIGMVCFVVDLVNINAIKYLYKNLLHL